MDRADVHRQRHDLAWPDRPWRGEGEDDLAGAGDERLDGRDQRPLLVPFGARDRRVEAREQALAVFSEADALGLGLAAQDAADQRLVAVGDGAGLGILTGHVQEVRFYDVRKIDTFLADLSNGLIDEEASVASSRPIIIHIGI